MPVFDYVYLHEGICVGKKKVSELWKLEFQMVLNHLM